MGVWSKTAQLFRLVNHKPYLHLGPEDEIASVNIMPDKCWIVIRRARIKQYKHSYLVTHRGVQCILFKRTGPDVWIRDQQTVLTPLAHPERHATYTGPTPEEHLHRTQWERWGTR